MVKNVVVLVCFVCLLGSITAASARFVQAAEPWWYCAFGFAWCVSFFRSITTGSARLLSFRRPNRGDIVSFGFVQCVPLLPPPIPSDSMHPGRRIVVILFFSCV